MSVATRDETTLALLKDKARLLRIHSIRSTTAAGSGHPTSSASAAEIVATLFFEVMRYDPANPKHPGNDTFILSKGHAAPVLYAAWAEAGIVSREELLNLRKLTSDLEGHPMPRLPWVDVGTGSLGQGLSAGLGIALNAKYLDRNEARVYVLLGDGESAEGAVWEAAAAASYYKVDNLCATIDVNRLGQSEATMLEHDLETYRARWTAFGWHAIVVDGHGIEQLLAAYDQAAGVKDKPSVVIARTFKGQGIPFAENKGGHHGKPFSETEAEEAIRILEAQAAASSDGWTPKLPEGPAERPAAGPVELPPPPYELGGKAVATRQAFGASLAELGKVDPRVVVLDGDVKNSTYTQYFQDACPDRFFQMFIAEQNMVGTAMGLATRGKIAFAASFACFLARAYDFIRMAAISGTNLKLVGTHVGVSIGEDGPSQMGLEDLAMFCAEPNFTVLYPSDGTSAWRAIQLAAGVTGPCYVRTSRPNTPVIYPADEPFAIGKAKVVRSSGQDQVTIVAGGVTLSEALTAYDQLRQEGIAARVIDLFSIQPVDRQTLLEAAVATGGLFVTVEDHYLHGGIASAVAGALGTERVAIHRMGVTEIPRSGHPEELIERYGISAAAIAAKVKQVLGR